ncbi:Mitochondrial dicarboxylate transporter [Ascosphaera pollenicola]|nr:Mitochondrial dicarboxylate transporter [Ascosphaera pollenicola]
MHSISNRVQAVFGYFSSVAISLMVLIALSTSLFPADVKTSVELSGVKVLKGRPIYYAPRREEYAQIRFDLDAGQSVRHNICQCGVENLSFVVLLVLTFGALDLSSLFNWNTKQVFLYVLTSYPSSIPDSNATTEAIIWDYIIPAKPSPYSLASLKEKYMPDKTKSKSKKTSKNNKTKGKKEQKHGVLRLRNQRPKYYLTDITRSLANRQNASLIVGWNVQPWVGPLMWSTGSKTAKNVGDMRVFNLGFVTAGDGGAESKKFDFPGLPEKKREAEAKKEFFFYVFVASFCWYWFPGYIAPFLSVFAWVTWIKPNNPVINQVFGGSTGMSIIPITFDWSQITGYISSPLMYPFHAISNTVIGVILWYWIVTPALHFTGKFEGKHLPISDSNTYDNTGAVYNVTNILTSQFTLDEEKYHNYSPLFMSTTYSLTYGLSFAAVSSSIIHTFLFNGREIVNVFRAKKGDVEDIHVRLMNKYKQVPHWWFALLGVIMIALCFVSALVWETHMTWWSVIVALAIPMFFTVPYGMIQGSTNVQLGLNVLTEFMVGYMLPGRPLAMMMFKTFGYITMAQALAFIQDMKLGLYLKVPPRTMFWSQLVGTFWSTFVQLGTILWAFGNIDGVCTPEQPNHYTCPGGKVFFNASVIWGLVGPGRLYSAGTLYGSLQWFWLAGAILPVIVYLLAIKWPKSGIRYFSAPILFGGTGQVPPASPMNYLCWAAVGTVFNKYIRNAYRGWWMRYNYVLSGALDSGLAICTILIFLTLGLTQTHFPSWWGTTIASSTMDMAGTAVQEPMPSGQKFGPTSWA